MTYLSEREISILAPALLLLAGAVGTLIAIDIKQREPAGTDWKRYGKCVHEMHVRHITVTPAIRDFCMVMAEEEEE